jgi:hypothetical protein
MTPKHNFDKAVAGPSRVTRSSALQTPTAPALHTPAGPAQRKRKAEQDDGWSAPPKRRGKSTPKAQPRDSASPERSL